MRRVISLLILFIGCGINYKQNDLGIHKLDHLEISKNKFHEEFKKKYGYEWGKYGFNIDSDWEKMIDKSFPEINNDQEQQEEIDAEPAIID